MENKSRLPTPIWHAPWKNYRVITGLRGNARSIAVDPSNNWFCTGTSDGTIKRWDLASGRLKETLTGHIGQVRCLAVSRRHTYMFSAGDDNLVKCWDLEQNMAVRSYHGHLNGVYCLALHPTIDYLFTGGRDCVCRVWDIRTKVEIHALKHDETVCSVFTRPMDPQVVTGSQDSTIKLWDLRTGNAITTLTGHKKSVRAMVPHPRDEAFSAASADSVKVHSLLRGVVTQSVTISRQNAIVNAMAVNGDGVLAAGGDDGSLRFWDWKSGYNLQNSRTTAQPGSLESEAGIYALTYDETGSRLVTCEADKTIKMWREDQNATPETHPLRLYGESRRNFNSY